MTRPALVVAALGLLAVSLSAQDPPESARSFDDSLEIDLVDLQVVVRDKQGEPVAGLSAEAFTATIDGDPVPITLFTEIRPTDEGERAADQDASPPREPMFVAIWIDNVHLRASARKTFLRDLWSRLENDLAPSDRLALVTYDGGTRVAVPFTADRDRLREALLNVATESSRGLAAQQELRQVINQINSTQVNNMTFCPADLTNLIRSHAASVYNRTLASVSALEGFVESMSGLPGRKAVIHIADALPVQPGGEAFLYAISMCDGTAASQGIQNAKDVTGGDGAYPSLFFDPAKARLDMNEFEISTELREMTSVAATNGVRIFTIQPNGLETRGQTAALVSGRYSSGELNDFVRHNVEGGLYFLADGRGGRAAIDSNDIKLDVDTAIDDLEHYYAIALQPEEAPDGRVHQVRISVDRPGVSVRHATAYRAKTADERVIDTVQTVMVHDLDANPYELGLTTGLYQHQNGALETRIQVDVPTGHLALVDRGQGHEGRVTLFLTVQSDDGSPHPFRRRSIPIRVDPDTDDLPVSIPLQVGLEGDLYGRTVIVALRDDLSGEISVVRHKVNG